MRIVTSVNKPQTLGGVVNVDSGVDALADGFYRAKKVGANFKFEREKYYLNFSGNFRLQNDDTYTITTIGFVDNNHTTVVSNATSGRVAGTPASNIILNNLNVGGFIAPAPMKVKKIRVYARQNNVANATNWGFICFKQLKGGNSATGEMILDDVEANINRVRPVINDFFWDEIDAVSDPHLQDVTINEGEILTFGVSSVTAGTTARQLLVSCAIIECEFV